jgi:hypothetical protein
MRGSREGCEAVDRIDRRNGAQWLSEQIALARIVSPRRFAEFPERRPMHGIIYLVGLVVVIMAILSFFGLR